MLKPIDLNLLLSKIRDKLGLVWIDSKSETLLEDNDVQALDLKVFKQEQVTVHTLIQQPENNELLDFPQSLQQLNDLIGQGYIRGIQQTLTQCRQNFPKHNELWDQLEQAIQKFDFKTRPTVKSRISNEYATCFFQQASPNEQAVILIVDDVPENLGLLHESLDQAGYRVLVTTDGLSAIEIAHRCLPDMILLDGNMPHMDGFESCIQLKASPITQLIPLVISTGGTKVTLDQAGIPTIAIDDVTGFPEMMDGRVKTLHPKIHGGLLARRDLDSHLQPPATMKLT